MATRPGFHTSEFIVTLLTVLGSIISATQDYISSGSAVKLSIGGAIAYIVSRGLAKYEPRVATSATAPTTQAGASPAP